VSPENKNGESRAWERALREMAPFLGLGATLAVTVVGLLAAGYHFYRLVRVKR
jgi:hypothetical protein